MRFGQAKSKKTVFFILLCSHLSLSFHKIRCGSAKQKVKKHVFYFALLSPFIIFADRKIIRLWRQNVQLWA